MRYDFVTVLGLVAACGCGEEGVALPTVQASSVHFRYFASSVERIPPGSLDRLERDRQDVLGYFGVSSESVVNYYRFDKAEDFNRLERCRDNLACTRGKDIFTTLVFDRHELVHAYLSDWQPGFLLDEGTAEALHCGDALRDWIAAAPQKMAWQDVVGQPPTDADVFRWGVRLVLHLLRTHGPRRFISYYQTAHHSDDPALFALEFERFWGEPLDGVWATLSQHLGEVPRPICPCAEPAIPSDGSPIAVSAFDDYRVLPAVASDQTIMLSTTADRPVLGACDGTWLLTLTSTVSQSSSGLLAALRLDTAKHFLAWGGAGSATVSSDESVQPNCSSAGILTVSTEVSRLAFVTPMQRDLAWHVGVSGPLLLTRMDPGPVSVTLTGDCSLASQVIPILPNQTVALSTGVFGMRAPTSPANNPAGPQAVLFDIFR